MRTIIAGSRDATEKAVLEAMSWCPWSAGISCVLSGTARGADKYGEVWADRAGIEVIRYPAQWDLYGKSAGYRRNASMALAADNLIAVWDGESVGTKHMIDLANKNNLEIFIFRMDIVDQY